MKILYIILKVGKQLISQEEQMMINNNNMIDDDRNFNGSTISPSDNEMTNDNLLCQLKVSEIISFFFIKISFLVFFKECEREIHRLKNLLDENCRMLKNDEMTTGEVTRSLADELTEVRVTFVGISLLIIII
jgi:hypothetical protein